MAPPREPAPPRGQLGTRAEVCAAAIGVFQNAYTASQIGVAIDNTGLPGAAQQVACVGAATPRPDWTAYLASESNVPLRCADGSIASGFASSAPNVTVIDPRFSAPRSVRSNLQWSGLALRNRLSASADVSYSLNLNQTGFVDLNFHDAPQFTLGDDGRPVFAARRASIRQAV